MSEFERSNFEHEVKHGVRDKNTFIRLEVASFHDEICTYLTRRRGLLHGLDLGHSKTRGKLPEVNESEK